jgi:hypothetical protein
MGLGAMKLNAGGVILGLAGLGAGIAIGLRILDDSKNVGFIAVGGLVLGALVGNLTWKALRRR